MTDKEKETLDFPREITMKIVFRNIPNIRETLISCLNENILLFSLEEKHSNAGTFLSFTLSSHFESRERLDEICTLLKSISGYQMMF